MAPDLPEVDRPFKRQRTEGLAPKSHHRLIVGIDYGTTYKGVSYVTTDKSELEDVNVIRSWPGKDGEWKTPTRIAYASENPKIAQSDNLWGYLIKPNMASCSWTKLLLDGDANVQESDDPDLQAAIAEGHLRLPLNITAQRVATDFLSQVYKHVEAKLAKELGQDVFDSTPMDCWLTVPAVWSDKAQAITKAAATTAGFALRTGDTMSVIPEPEAAAITVLRSMARSESLTRIKAGETILICDCGGGTVDITSYTVSETDPIPAFEEVCVGIGGKCWASSIDRTLQRLMSERFGSSWDDLEQRLKGPGSHFMNSWEIAKRQLSPEDGGEDIQELGPVNLKVKGVTDFEWYDEEEQMVKLTRDDIVKVFEPTVQEVLKLVSKQKTMIEQEGKSLDRLALVGGFGDSNYLYSSLKKWCKVNGGIDAICPEYPQAAIVRGAALRGLTGMAPRKRRCRRHYGIQLRDGFREGIDPEDWAVFDPYDGRKLCKHRMIWLFSKGEDMTESSVARHKINSTQRVSNIGPRSISLYSCTRDEPPDYLDDTTELVGSIEFKFDESTCKGLRQRNGYVDIKSEVEIIFGSTTGVLDVRIITSGKVKGYASLVYE